MESETLEEQEGRITVSSPRIVKKDLIKVSKGFLRHEVWRDEVK